MKVVVALAGLVCALANTALVADDGDSACEITSLFLRSALGYPIQVTETGDATYEAVMCNEMKKFQASVKISKPVFASGKKCAISGVPSGLSAVDDGSTTDFTLTLTETSKDGEKTTKDVSLAVKRLGMGMDQAACEVTVKRNAVQDCGYAPILEKRRQEAAVIKGMAPPPEEALLQQMISRPRAAQHGVHHAQHAYNYGMGC